MGPRRLLTAALVLGAAVVAGWLAAPRRFVVEGVSMGPGLLPGDVVRTGLCPGLDRLRQPRRFERWVLAATDGLAVKRVVGLPGEHVSILDGDLVGDGATILKGPRLLAELGSVVDEATPREPASDDATWTWSAGPDDILDHAPFDTGSGATRALVTVRDVGLTAVIDVPQTSAAAPATVRLLVGDTVVTRSLVTPGRHAVVAGRLDGRLVVASWGVPADAGPAFARSCLPPGPPAAWEIAEPWPPAVGSGDAAPRLGVGTTPAAGANLVAVRRWRDVVWRPGADGTSSWRLGADDVFVLGDHPPASNDSRRWGPITIAALRYRVDPAHAPEFPEARPDAATATPGKDCCSDRSRGERRSSF